MNSLNKFLVAVAVLATSSVASAHIRPNGQERNTIRPNNIRPNTKALNGSKTQGANLNLGGSDGLVITGFRAGAGKLVTIK